MSTLCIFNPEHDLALANGSKYFMPPHSATLFADHCHSLMNILHDGLTTSINSAHQYITNDIDYFVAWGWDAMLKQSLIHAGFSEKVLPTDEWIDFIRKMQNRTAMHPLLTNSHIITHLSDIEAMLPQYQKMLLKSPWSGSGRGIRLLFDTFNDKIIAWINKVIAEQGAVIAEPFRHITLEFALEYNNEEFVGYSLFDSINCVYHANRLLFDDEIETLILQHTTQLSQKKAELEQWLKDNIFPKYQGPLGVDLYIDDSNILYISEMNLRYTIGHVAHAYLQQRPECHGKSLSIDKMKGIVIS